MAATPLAVLDLVPISGANGLRFGSNYHVTPAQEATGADELIITTTTHDHADRVSSYQMLAREWERR
ncbi:MAG: hypothetical protein ABSB01_25765 [Streptosporangiaceae bacterium]|jgi:hypothetical protein